MNIDGDALSRRPPPESPDTPRESGEAPIDKNTVQAVIDYALHVDVETSPYVELVGQISACTPQPTPEESSAPKFPKEPQIGPKSKGKTQWLVE